MIRATPSSRRPGFRRRVRGFTIVEVIAAACILAFTIAGSITVLVSGFHALDTARNTTLSAQIIQSEMERIRLLSWDGVSALPDSANIQITSIFPASDQVAARFSAVRTTATVSGTSNLVKKITVTVSWTGIDGQSHRRSSTTCYCKNGLYDYYYTLARS